MNAHMNAAVCGGCLQATVFIDAAVLRRFNAAVAAVARNLLKTFVRRFCGGLRGFPPIPPYIPMALYRASAWVLRTRVICLPSITPNSPRNACGCGFFDGSSTRMGEGDLAGAMFWLHDHFFMIRDERESQTLGFILASVAAAVLRHGVWGIVLDACAAIEQQYE